MERFISDWFFNKCMAQKTKKVIRTFMHSLSGLIVKPIKRFVGIKDDVDLCKGEYELIR